MPKFPSHFPDSSAVILFFSVDGNSVSFQLMRPKTLKVFLFFYFQPVMKFVCSSNFNPSPTTSAVNTLVQSIIVSHLSYASSPPTYMSASTLTPYIRHSAKYESVYVALHQKTLQRLHISFRIEPKCFH